MAGAIFRVLVIIFLICCSSGTSYVSYDKTHAHSTKHYALIAPSTTPLSTKGVPERRATFQLRWCRLGAAYHLSLSRCYSKTRTHAIQAANLSQISIVVWNFEPKTLHTHNSTRRSPFTTHKGASGGYCWRKTLSKVRSCLVENSSRSLC